MDRQYQLLDGSTFNTATLSREEARTLEDLEARVRGGMDYFELLRHIKGKDSPLLENGRVAREVIRRPVFQIAADMVGRAGIAQGCVLAPLGLEGIDQEELLSLGEAAQLLLISRAAVHQALREHRLDGRQVGTAWVIRRADVEEYGRRRSQTREPAAV